MVQTRTDRRSHSAAVATSAETSVVSFTTANAPTPSSGKNNKPKRSKKEHSNNSPPMEIVVSLGPAEDDIPPRYKSRVEARVKLFQRFLKDNKLAVHPHQEAGVRWCLTHEMHPEPPFGVRGGFVADEMGLGKTILMIGVMMAHDRKRTLVVVPNVLAMQWYMQILAIKKHPTAVLYISSTRHLISCNDLPRIKIVVTTYSMLHDERLQYLQWDRVIFDEAHYLRNYNTQRYELAKSLKAGMRWLVTGTPINNGMADYYSLAAMLGLPATAYHDCVMVYRRYLLHRTKQEVGLKLPPLTFHDLPVQCQRAEEQFLHDVVHGQLSFTNIKPDTTKFQPEQFPFAMQVKKYSSIQLLGKARQMSAYLPFTESKLEAVLGHVLTNARMFPLVRHILFCSYHSEIDYVEKRLADEGYECTVVDGRHPMGTDLKKFLILQINSCCEGLNLQQYTHLYFVMPHWNPAVELQAIARAHRIGQMQMVHVHRFYFAAERTERSSTFVAANALEAFLRMGARTVYDDEPITMDQYVRQMQYKKSKLQVMRPAANDGGCSAGKRKRGRR